MALRLPNPINLTKMTKIEIKREYYSNGQLKGEYNYKNGKLERP